MYKKGKTMDSKKAIKLFNDQKIRVQWDEEEEKWYFSIVDVVGVLAESENPRRYWSDLKRKLRKEGSQLYEKIVQLKMLATDGKTRLTDVADTEQLLRIIQSIPSPNAEPFKVWLARVGYERIEEAEDPEKTIERALDTYHKKGYSPQWINQRLKSIEVRKELTDEWQRSGVQKGKEYAILTNEITEAWSGHTVKDYKRVKGLKKENLRDNMSNLELVLNMLAEATTAEISKEKQPKGFDASKQIARQGGRVAGNTRKEIEERTGKPVVTSKNARDLLEDSNNEALESGEENE
jgi:hypothetical protein